MVTNWRLANICLSWFACSGDIPAVGRLPILVVIVSLREQYPLLPHIRHRGSLDLIGHLALEIAIGSGARSRIGEASRHADRISADRACTGVFVARVTDYLVVAVDADWRGPSDTGGVSVFVSGINARPDGMMFAHALPPLCAHDSTSRTRSSSIAPTGQPGRRVGHSAIINGHQVRVVGVSNGLRALGGVNVVARWTPRGAGYRSVRREPPDLLGGQAARSLHSERRADGCAATRPSAIRPGPRRISRAARSSIGCSIPARAPACCSWLASCSWSAR